MLTLDVQLHPSKASISNTVVDGRVGGVRAAEGMMAARVDEVAASAERVEEKRPEHSHAQHCPEDRVWRGFDVGDVTDL